MVKKTTFILILILSASCGRDVNISTKQLSANSQLKDGSNLVSTSAILTRGKPDMINVGGTSYKVSIYSSYQALEFIAAKPLTTQMQVTVKGRPKGTEYVLEKIQPQ